MLPYIFICKGCGVERRTDLRQTRFCSKRCQQQYYHNKRKLVLIEDIRTECLKKYGINKDIGGVKWKLGKPEDIENLSSHIEDSEREG